MYCMFILSYVELVHLHSLQIDFIGEQSYVESNDEATDETNHSSYVNDLFYHWYCDSASICRGAFQ